MITSPAIKDATAQLPLETRMQYEMWLERVRIKMQKHIESELNELVLAGQCRIVFNDIAEFKLNEQDEFYEG